MLDVSSVEKNNNCQVHKEPLNFYCLTDKCKICKECAQNGAHSGHKAQSISDILSKAATKRNRLKSVLSDFEGEVHNVHALLEENKKKTLGIMRKKFGKLRELTLKKEQQIAAEVELIFSQEKMKLNNEIGNDLSLRKFIRNKISNLNQVDEVNEALLKELEDDSFLANFNIADQYRAVYSHSKELQQSIEDAFNNLLSLTSSFIQEFKPLPEPVLVQAKQESKQKKPPTEVLFSFLGPVLHEYKPLSKSLINLAKQEIDSGFPIEGLFMENNLKIENEFGWFVVYPRRPEDDLIQVGKNNMNLLGKCKESTKVCLDFRKQKPDKKMMSTIEKLWKEELRNVRAVKVLLTSTDKEFDNEDLQDLCEKNFWCGDKQIQSLNICLIRTKIGESGMKRLAQVIDGQNLKNFTLDCSYGSTFTDGCLREISNGLIGKLQSVESFDLRISSTAVSEVGLEIFFKAFGRVMPHVQSLDLWLDFTKIKEKGFESFNKNLLPLGKNLTALSVHYPKFTGSNGEYVKGVLECVEKGLKVSQLGLYFDMQEVVSESVKKYVEQWKRNHRGVNVNF